MRSDGEHECPNVAVKVFRPRAMIAGTSFGSAGRSNGWILKGGEIVAGILEG